MLHSLKHLYRGVIYELSLGEVQFKDLCKRLNVKTEGDCKWACLHRRDGSGYSEQYLNFPKGLRQVLRSFYSGFFRRCSFAYTSEIEHSRGVCPENRYLRDIYRDAPPHPPRPQSNLLEA